MWHVQRKLTFFLYPGIFGPSLLYTGLNSLHASPAQLTVAVCLLLLRGSDLSLLLLLLLNKSSFQTSRGSSPWRNTLFCHQVQWWHETCAAAHLWVSSVSEGTEARWHWALWEHHLSGQCWYQVSSNSSSLISVYNLQNKKNISYVGYFM